MHNIIWTFHKGIIIIKFNKDITSMCLRLYNHMHARTSIDCALLLLLLMCWLYMLRVTETCTFLGAWLGKEYSWYKDKWHACTPTKFLILIACRVLSSGGRKGRCWEELLGVSPNSGP